MESDGYSLDDKRTRIDGKGDIPDIVERFKARKTENYSDRKAKFFHVPVKEIIDNNYDLSITKYKEIEYEEVEYEKPEVILNQIEELEKQILANVTELRSMLKKEY